jgi:hypothetical protein
MELMEKFRNQNRVEILWPSECVLGGVKKIKALVLNISESGMKLQSNFLEKKLLNQVIELKSIYVPGLAAINTKARIKWMANDLAGLEFTELSKKNETILNSLIKFHSAT